MFKDALIIFNKELTNVGKDRGAVFSNYLLPLFLMPVIFFGISQITTAQQQSAADSVYPVYVANSPGPEFEQLLGSRLKYQQVASGPERDKIGIEFPAGYVPGARTEVRVLYDSTTTAGTYAGGVVLQVLDQYNNQQAERLLESRGLSSDALRSLTPVIVDTAPQEAQGSSFLSIMVPYMVLIFLFAGSIGMGINITAGEKEKGALAALLVNQVSRSSIALGKVFFLMFSSVVSGFMSASGLIIAAAISPGMMQTGSDVNAAGLLRIDGMIALLLVIVSAGAAIAALVVVLGNLAKNMKEATGYVMPIYILVVLLGVFTMSLDANTNLGLFFIPLGNLIFAIKNLVTSQSDVLQILITVGVNLLVTAVLVAASTRLFNSEKILDTFSA